MNKLWRSLAYVISPMIVVLAVSIALIRANAPLVTTGVGVGKACDLCSDSLNAPWIRIEVENRGWSSVTIKSVSTEGSDSANVLKVVGISTPSHQIPAVPQKDERIHSIGQWAIPRTSEFKFSVHVAFDKRVVESDPQITEANIHYVYFGLPFTLKQRVKW